MQILYLFFVDDIDFLSNLNERFMLKKSDFKNTQIEYLSDQVKTGRFTLNLYYVVGDFFNHQLRDENFGVLFLETVNNSFMLYLIYVKLFLKVFFNNANIFPDMLLDNYFSEKNTLMTNVRNKKETFIFSDELYSKIGIRFLRYLNLTLNNAFEYMILTYKPKKYFYNEYLKIINFH